MSDWDAVRQLAADFQKLQSSTGAFRLSERNCVEVVTKLVDMGLLEILYTLDGKEYITPQHLDREIRNELMANRGRINIVDLQQILNVDLSHIEAKVGDILKRDRNVVLLQGELIDRSYIDALCEEVNETLQEVGQVAVSDLSKNFGLPNDFLIEHIESAIGSKIKGQLDKNGSGAIYTDAFVARYRARIRGLFNAITRPTAVGPIIAQGSYQEKLFLSVVHDLVSSGTLAGTLHGHMDKAVYIPHVYTRMQNRWADSFLQSNGYLEFDTLSRLGIDNPQGFISQRYSSREDVLELVTCVVGDVVMTELGAAVEEALTTDGWVEMLPLLPSPCTPEDAQLLVQKKYSVNPDLKVVGGFLIRKSFVQSCFDHFQPLVQEKAQKVATTDAARVAEMIQRSLEQEELSSQKGGGRKKSGKEKRTKGKRGAGPQEKISKGDGDKWELQFMSTEQISAALLDKFPECSENVLADIASEISSPLQLAFQEEARTALSNLGQGSSASQQRKRHANIQDSVCGRWSTARLFDKAILLFDGDAATQLSKYLLRTLCSDLTNLILLFIAEDCGLNLPELEDMNGKERAKLISSLNDRTRKVLSDLEKSLSAKTTVTFFGLFEKVCLEDFCGIMLKKLDKKKERQLLFSHQQALLENLKEEQDPAMMLHLITVILFQQHTGCIVHIPGKLVSQVLAFLAERLELKDYEKLSECQRLVAQLLRSQSAAMVKGSEGSSDDTSNTSKSTEETEATTGTQDTGLKGQGPTQEQIDRQRLNELLSDLKQAVLTKPPKASAP